jgi:RHH-type transcriptional regulator, proline utilization regulon repressor / proline dehydrogenase / delta 1-pyrroline-5-carboxylate dehydrogenase
MSTMKSGGHELRAAIASAYLEDEAQVLERLVPLARLAPEERRLTGERACKLVEAVRVGRRPRGGLDAFLQEYDLSNEEGVLLMCLAEALLRIPDPDTADWLIKDKIGGADWKRHLGHSDSAFVNASTWGLMLTGEVVRLGDLKEGDWSRILGRLVTRSGEPIIRQAIYYAMRIMGRQFVLGRTIKEALREGRPEREKGVRHSFDMLGEAARTMADADRYFEAYADAVDTVAKAHPAGPDEPVYARPSISVKLSALHPRYEELQRGRVMDELKARLTDLVLRAKAVNVGLSVDAEEADRLEMSLDLYESIWTSREAGGWEGFGPVVQAYQKRALPVIDWLTDLATRQGKRIPVRLVKGAYWDTEIKYHQVMGAEGYPVFTRKVATDVAYLACARRLLAHEDRFYPQFATHNAHTVAAITAMAGPDTEFEFQRLHGMGQPLYDEVLSGGIGRRAPLRIYAPVGSHEDLLAYLVRRLLENGANSSFVHRLANDEAPVEDIIADPVETLERAGLGRHPRIPLPEDIYGDRKNAIGPLLTDPHVRGPLMEKVKAAVSEPLEAGPVIGGELTRPADSALVRTDPADRRRVVGMVTEADEKDVDRALTIAVRAQEEWDRRGGAARAGILAKAADLYEADLPRLIALCVREAGKSVPNALADVREAIDFLRYYANRARAEFQEPMVMPGPTGERNELSLHGRGVFACISPWNFPIAIFTGQVTAALAAGNAVAAKPAEQTPLCAHAAVDLLHRAGVPGEVLHFLPGPGETVGAALTKDPRVAGIAFTGGTDTARIINRTLAARDGGPIPVLIAETGGQNALIVDSSALPEQVTKDVLTSAFDSAGQRCSALRVLYVQDDVADRMIAMIAGAMEELRLGDPMDISTDVGPVIDREAQETLERHVDYITGRGRLVYRCTLPDECAHGTFFAPLAVEIESLDLLEREVFGPVLHIIRYSSDRLDAVCDAVNATGYGLTLGIHTRIEEKAEYIARRVHVGNAYVNRNQIGAVVGVQPFGGEGLSGTGPKAGGPHYLHRFAVERSRSIDTTASGGNAALMSLGDL